MNNLFDKKDVFSWANCEEAKKHIGEEGYFCDEFKEDLGAWHQGILQEIDSSLLVGCIFRDNNHGVYGLFLPADKVKQPEPKKWRAFENYNEFQATTGKSVGDVLTLKNKSDDYTTIRMITGSCRDILEIGASTFNFQFLFDECLWFDDEKTEEWQPFGVEE